MAMLSKDQILKARTSQIKKTEIAELGGEVFIRMVSMRESMQFQQISEGMKAEEVAVLYASFLLANKDGSRMFSTDEDLEFLSDLAPSAIMKITDTGNAMNGVSPDEAEDIAKK